MKAVIFDLDWTLVNSTIDFNRMKQKILSYLDARGIKDSAFAAGQQLRTVEIINVALSHSNETGIRETINLIMNQVELENVNKTKPISGAKEVLHYLRAKGIKIGVLTRGHKAYAIKALQVSCLYSYVDIILARDQTEKPKPDPLQLFQAIETLQTKPEETLMVGDSLLDAQCAKEANVAFIGVLGGVSSNKDFEEFGCKTVISTITDLTEFL